jgi:hypothetical protein
MRSMVLQLWLKQQAYDTATPGVTDENLLYGGSIFSSRLTISFVPDFTSADTSTIAFLEFSWRHSICIDSR